ncbi:ABC transporter permease [Arthrobacter gandavensis]|uniref:ABC transporter permease n=1 Tax=Arthrobacter gandavensis TaxID=169960 RepID=UPI00188E0B6D|nr:ABC transporter permease [Arthrobacter gandavensis]MBF4994357.1 ABC transporter permease [Arthrobacter gandavensis]
MNVVLDITTRNLRLFFRDRLGVFFSLVSALVVFLLYTLFLGNLQTEGLGQSFPQATEDEIRGFVDSWMFAGILGITTITTALGAMVVFVEDSGSGRFQDFLVSPIRREKLILGYLLSAVLISMVMTALVLVVSLVYLFVVSGVTLAAVPLLKICGYLTLACFAFSALSAFAVSFIRTPGAYSALSTIVGTVLGFIAGSYIPVGNFPEGVRQFVSALPFLQSSMLVRQEMTAETLPAMTGDQPAAIEELQGVFGITAQVGDWQVGACYVVFVLLAMTVVFTLAAAIRIRGRVRA